MSELNLIPYHLKKKNDRSKQRMFYIKNGIIGLGILILLIIIPNLIVFGVNIQESYYKNAVETMNIKTIDQQIKELEKEIEDYKFYINKVKLLTENQKLTMERIRKVESFVPLDVYFKSLTYGVESININAITQNINAVDGFAATLEMSGEYKTARVTSLTKSTVEGIGPMYEFTIVLEY